MPCPAAIVCKTDPPAAGGCQILWASSLDRVNGDVPLSGIEAPSIPAASKSLSQQNTTPRAGIPPGCPEMMPPNGRDIGQAGMGIKNNNNNEKKNKQQNKNKKKNH